MPVKTTPSEYQYSKPVTIREWNGGKITVKVGYVQKHPERRDLVLEKYWAAPAGKPGYQQFNVKDAKDWKQICATVDNLWPELEGIISEANIKNAIQKVAAETELLDLLSQYPEIIGSLPHNVNLLTLPEEQRKALFTFLEVGRDIAGKALTRLSKEPIEDVHQLIKILENYKLSTVNSLVTYVTSRLSFIDTFEKVIHNSASYERKGADSVHNLLKANIWLVDRNYSILNDDETLKNIIFEQWKKQVNGQEMEQRPDFLCMTKRTEPNDTLVIIEIKRPRIVIKFEMVEQALRYRAILKNHSGKSHEYFKAFLVGKTIDPLLHDNSLSESGIVVKTYTDFIGDARRFYEEYLEIVKKEQYAI